MKLNAEEIKKALECCKTPLASDCENCRYTGKRLEDGVYEGCVNCLVGDALALITSLEQRIKNLEYTKKDMNELDAEQAINELETQTNYAKFIGSEGVLLSAKCATFVLEHARYYEQRIKELSEENEAWQKQLIATEEKSEKAYYDLACEVEDLRTENESLHASCTELARKMQDNVRKDVANVARKRLTKSQKR